MKKKFGLIGIALVVAVLTSLCFGGVALAGDGLDADINWSNDSGAEGEVDVTWNGSGYVGGGVTVGPGWDGGGTSFATSSFHTAGSDIIGSYSVSAQGNTTYDVWGDVGPTTTSAITASVSDGFVRFQNARTGRTPYGVRQGHPPPGQFSYNFVGTGYFDSGGQWVPGTGSGQLSMNSYNNYVHLYTSGGAFDASGEYTIISQFANNGSPGSPTDNWAGLLATSGNGTADIDMGHSSAGYYGAGQIDFGFGCGCGTHADATFTGFGQFTLSGTGSNSVTTPSSGGWTVNGDGTYNSASLSIVANFVNGASISDYSVSVR